MYDYGDTYMAIATDGNLSVCNCYGSTPEIAKEIAQYKMRRAYENVDL